MGKKKVEHKINKIKAFVKFVNYNHLMPTRFMLAGEFASKDRGELKSVVTEDKMADPAARKKLVQECKNILKER